MSSINQKRVINVWLHASVPCNLFLWHSKPAQNSQYCHLLACKYVDITHTGNLQEFENINEKEIGGDLLYWREVQLYVSSTWPQSCTAVSRLGVMSWTKMWSELWRIISFLDGRLHLNVSRCVKDSFKIYPDTHFHAQWSVESNLLVQGLYWTVKSSMYLSPLFLFSTTLKT